jgi:hypothetical protein
MLTVTCYNECERKIRTDILNSVIPYTDSIEDFVFAQMSITFCNRGVEVFLRYLPWSVCGGKVSPKFYPYTSVKILTEHAISKIYV